MKKGKLRVVTLILSLSLIIGIGIYAFLKNQSINENDTVQDLNGSGVVKLSAIFHSDYEMNEQTEFGTCNGYIVKCTKDGVKWFDKDGEEKYNLIMLLDNPMLKISGSNILIANIGGRDVYSIENHKVKWQKTLGETTQTDNGILNADINESGYVTVIQKTDRYKGEVTLIDPDGKIIFTRFKGESFVLSSLVSKDAKQIMINTNNTSGITINSTLEFINTDKINENNGTPFAEITRKDSIFSFIRFLNGSNIVAAGENFINCYDNQKKLWWTKKLKKIYSVDCAYDKFIVTAVKSDNKSTKIGTIRTDINTYNDDGTLRSSFGLKEGVVNVRACNSIIAVNTGRQAVFTDIDGNLKGKYSSKMDILRIEFLDRSYALVITKDTIDVVKL